MVKAKMDINSHAKVLNLSLALLQALISKGLLGARALLPLEGDSGLILNIIIHFIRDSLYNY